MFRLLKIFIAKLIYGHDRTRIDFDVDAMDADGRLCAYRTEVIDGIKHRFRKELSFNVTNRSLLRYRPNLIVARVINAALMDGYSVQYVQLFTRSSKALTEEQIASGFSSTDLAQEVYTQLGRIDTIAFLQERKLLDERMELGDGVPSVKFNFSTPSPFQRSAPRTELSRRLKSVPMPVPSVHPKVAKFPPRKIVSIPPRTVTA